MTATIAMTNNMCINDPALYTKNPNAHAINSMTAMAYNKLLIVIKFDSLYTIHIIVPSSGKRINTLKHRMGQIFDGGFPQLWGINSTAFCGKNWNLRIRSHGMIFTLLQG